MVEYYNMYIKSPYFKFKVSHGYAVTPIPTKISVDIIWFLKAIYGLFIKASKYIKKKSSPRRVWGVKFWLSLYKPWQ